MPYNSDSIKKEYEKNFKNQRIENLIRLRKIHSQTQLEFAKDIGFTTKDVSALEKGTKHLSLFHVNAYRKFFKENYNLNVSVDFLMGYSQIIDNISDKLSESLGLEPQVIERLKALNSEDAVVDLNTIFNQFVMNERVFYGILWNLHMYSHAEEFLPYLCKDEEDEPDEIELSDLFFVVDDKGHNIQLDCEIFETIAERNILHFLREFKDDLYSESEGD